jgi:integrase
MAGQKDQLPVRYVSEALEKYAAEVSINKRGQRWEVIRLRKFAKPAAEGGLPFLNRVISEVTQTDIASWRNESLRRLQPSSVNREWNLLHNVFQVARKEWRWLREMPFKDVSRPKDPPHRKRRVTGDELNAMCAKLGYTEDGVVESKSQEVALAFQIAVETGMRAGELLSLTDDLVDLSGREAHLPQTKNSDPRSVPLSTRAVELLRKVHGRGKLFTVSSASLDTLFRKARASVVKEGKMPEIASLHFHDSRHEACTRLARKVTVLELARIIGHRDLKSLLIYYNPTTQELAEKLG